ncbi:hypothetical protein VP193E371_P0214 [Vibrio phage 193E37-1]|nr:hypothetical protein VP193E371_P0214 [Vibrio phage 193E37-1]
MKVNLDVECEKVSEIDPWGPYRVDIALINVDLDSVIESIGLGNLLEYISVGEIKSHLEEKGYTVSEEEA